MNSNKLAQRIARIMEPEVMDSTEFVSELNYLSELLTKERLSTTQRLVINSLVGKQIAIKDSVESMIPREETELVGTTYRVSDEADAYLREWCKYGNSFANFVRSLISESMSENIEFEELEDIGNTKFKKGVVVRQPRALYNHIEAMGKDIGKGVYVSFLILRHKKRNK